jgi:hypothetical protein
VHCRSTLAAAYMSNAESSRALCRAGDHEGARSLAIEFLPSADDGFVGISPAGEARYELPGAPSPAVPDR